MKLYLVVEGRRTEPKLYTAWLTHYQPSLVRYHSVEELVEGAEDGYHLVAGGGYPSYLDRIRNAVDDINGSLNAGNAIDALMVCVDTEGDFTIEEKIAELNELLSNLRPDCVALPIVQNLCIETWLLGNRKFFHRQPQSQELVRFQKFYSVLEKCPETMPSMPGYLTPVSFHLAYFRHLCWERNTSYSKKNPGPALAGSFLEELLNRHASTGHLPSLATLASALEILGSRNRDSSAV